ncbi:reticulon-like protein B13 [Aristolochia californica]|uniref:reticulon-like protein B13 n=1 Tax=Aristolochia californica TaxID=171875 RepID=UPI0035D88D85
MSTKEQEYPLPTRDTLRDIFLWRKKILSAEILVVSTLIYGALEIYQYKFLPVVCWVLMTIFSSAFLWVNLLRLVSKEVPSLSGLEVSEESALEAAAKLKARIEETIRWMFEITVERDWFEFVRVVVGLYLLSLLGRQFDFLVIVYIGELMGFVVPIIYTKNQDRLRSWEERVRMKGRRWCNMANEKITSMKGGKVHEEKKME